VQTPAAYIWLRPGWYPWLEFGLDNPDATVTAIRERVESELGGRFEKYYPNDPEEGTEYYSIFLGKTWLLLDSKNGRVAGFGADWRDIPLMLRIAALYGAERRGWRWLLYRLWQRRPSVRPQTMNTSGNNPWLLAAILFGSVYLVVGVAFPNPSAANATQFLWRLAAWLTCAVAFAIHIGIEHFRLHNSPLRTALHVAVAVALGAFALAAAANIHARRAGTGNQSMLALSLVIWPVITGVPAFVVALAAAAGLARVRPHDKPRSP